MDKIKPILALLKKHLFWELLVISLIAMLVGWISSTQALASKTDEQKRAIDSNFEGLRGITGEMPNSKWNERVDEVAEKARKDVFEAWNSLYAMQQKEVLRWPDDLPQKDRFEQWKPGTEMTQSMREGYFNFIEDHFPKMLAIIDAEDQRASNARGAGAPRTTVRTAPQPVMGNRPKVPAGERDSTTEEAHDYKVVWVPESQQYIAKKMLFPSQQKEEVIAQTQESIWVCEALLHIIADVNRDANGSYDATIKQIDALELGSSASQKMQSGRGPGHIEVVAVEGATGTGVPAPPPAAPMGDSRLGQAGTADMLENPQERYVGDDGQLFEGDINNEQIRRIPVYLRLRMDQTKIQNLFYSCATSALPVEVRQFRLNPTGGASGGGMMDRGRGMGGMQMSRTGVGQVIELSEGTLLDGGVNPNDATVELHGIIYIFNPPDMSKMGAAPAAATPPPGA